MYDVEVVELNESKQEENISLFLISAGYLLQIFVEGFQFKLVRDDNSSRIVDIENKIKSNINFVHSSPTKSV